MYSFTNRKVKLLLERAMVICIISNDRLHIAEEGEIRGASSSSTVNCSVSHAHVHIQHGREAASCGEVGGESGLKMTCINRTA
jgi:hypothetical protein